MEENKKLKKINDNYFQKRRFDICVEPIIYKYEKGLDITMSIEDFKATFGKIKDFRQPWKTKHKLIEILFIAVVATIANADGWIEIGDFAEDKEQWLRKYLSLKNGVPSHDTFKRVFENIDSDAFNKAFIDWTRKMSDHTDGRIVAVDGKTSRRSHDGEKGAIHLVNAWVDENDIILG
ncbi:DDE_Tnp_1-associated [Paramaledivibacter caminithermalis DSM 15212]|uniref:DDE_Tnp_1-associated n=1 Tax=Paramaledivibacter caminithermalis (strain DSM 15212 / CIP 107654 / DViRD3) TaxID=1121301 RepID=A0A1M6R6D8_PARC5|nr:DDE_Tnp_1-associated [Paramaledivibacter caminithermalis DSM 15212]